MGNRIHSSFDLTPADLERLHGVAVFAKHRIDDGLHVKIHASHLTALLDMAKRCIEAERRLGGMKDGGGQ
jgi:hypothetical protein